MVTDLKNFSTINKYIVFRESRYRAITQKEIDEVFCIVNPPVLSVTID